MGQTTLLNPFLIEQEASPYALHLQQRPADPIKFLAPGQGMAGIHDFESQQLEIGLAGPEIVLTPAFGFRHDLSQRGFGGLCQFFGPLPWSGKQKALQQIRFGGQRNVSLGIVLDAFNQHQAATLPNHPDQAVQQQSRPGVILGVHQQRPVNLHDQRVDAPQALKIGITHAKVVDGDLEPPGLGFLDELQQRGAVPGGGLHQLQHDFLRMHTQLMAMVSQYRQVVVMVEQSVRVDIDKQPDR